MGLWHRFVFARYADGPIEAPPSAATFEERRWQRALHEPLEAPPACYSRSAAVTVDSNDRWKPTGTARLWPA